MASPCAWPSSSSCSGREATLAAELLRGGTVVDATGSRRADVLVAEGVVVAVGEALAAPTPGRVLDAGGWVAAPGLVDLHPHPRHPGRVVPETGEPCSTVAGPARLAARTATPD